MIEPLGTNPVSRRAAKYVNDEFDGNVTAAAAALDVSYDRLWRLVTGRVERVDVALVWALARHSKRSLDWWLEGAA